MIREPGKVQSNDKHFQPPSEPAGALTMPARLLKFAFSREHPEPRMFTRHETLKPSYDVVIIGAGGHGLASA